MRQRRACLGFAGGFAMWFAFDVSASRSAGASCGANLETLTSVGTNCLGDAASAVTGAAFDHMVKSFLDAFTSILKVLVTAWTAVPTDNSTSNGTIQWLSEHTIWLGVSVAVVMVMIAGARLAIERRGDAARDAAFVLVRFVLVAGAGTALISALSVAGDEFSKWILDQSTTGGNTLGTGLGGIADNLAKANVATALVLVFSTVGIIVSLIQIGLLLVRNAMMILLTGLWPVAAASSGTKYGRQAFDKMTGWIVAFLLFKPVAACIYATAFRAWTADASLLGITYGVVLMVLAVLALPALMRFVAPVTGGVGQVSGAQVVGAGAAVATGAIAIPAMGAMAGGSMAAGGGGGAGMGAAQATGASQTAGSGAASGSSGAGDAGGSATGAKGGADNGSPVGGDAGADVPAASGADPSGGAGAEASTGGVGGGLVGAVASGASKAAQSLEDVADSQTGGNQ